MIFETLADKFHFRFKDRITAAGILAESLKDKINTEERKDAIVLAIPRGGVVTGDIVARKLSCRLGIIIPRKLTDPDNKEHAIGAIMEDGTTYLDQELVNHLQISPNYLEQEKLRQIEEIRRRKSLFIGGREGDLNDKIVLLVDDGAATGATIIVAARSIRKQFKLKCLIIALPVATKDTVKLLKKEADLVEVVTSPSKHFYGVGQYYQDFRPVEDEQVRSILQSWWN
ncbi:MAG: phosphoribosyltransferase family protein [Candidatus Nitrosopolaris sp.]